MNLEPINSETVVNEVFKRISDSIIKQDILPGEKLPTEIELMEKLGVGRNSIREAIKMLSVMGVLEVKRGNGTYVSTKVSPSMFNPLVFSLILEPKSAFHLYEFRMMFENMVLFLSIEKATAEDFDSIERLLGHTKSLMESKVDDIDTFVNLDIEFHIELMKATHNPLVELIGKTVIELFPRYIKNSMSQRNGILRSITNHYKILKVIREKDKNSVFDLVEETLSEWKEQWRDSEE